jgi:NADH-quinone oxidoreductase subunit E
VSPLVPKGRRPWTADPGHIHDVPEPPPMPVEQERVGVEIPPDEIEARQAAEEQREPHGEPAPVPDPSEVEVPRALAQQIRQVMKRYPRKRSAAIPALWAVQRRYGWCTPEGIRQAAAVMGVTPGYLQSVASFYDLFRLEPEGEHQVLVCTNISCWLRGADRVLFAFQDAAGRDRVARAGAPTRGTPGREAEEVPDEVFVRGFECLGACDLAPMASIDERYYGPLTDDDAEDVIEQLRSGKPVLPEKRLEDRPAAGGPRGSGDKRIAKHPLNKGTRPSARAKAKPATKPKGKR